VACACNAPPRLLDFGEYPWFVIGLAQASPRLVAVSLKEGTDISDADLRKALTDAGYTVKEITRSTTPIADVRERIK